jgi:hypothetical protein
LITQNPNISERKFGVRVEISLGKRLLTTVVTVYLQTIGHMTKLFKEFFFEAVITVNITCMLVYTNMFINISNNLPETPYVKMMDKNSKNSKQYFRMWFK